MIQLSTKYNNHIISCTALKIGNDFNISIYGGDIPHIGAVALGVPVTLPHNINKITSTASLGQADIPQYSMHSKSFKSSPI